MELDYSGAKNLEEARAIQKAYWDNFHQEVLDGKWVVVSWEERQAHRAAMAAERKKLAQERMMRDQQNQQNQCSDDLTKTT